MVILWLILNFIWRFYFLGTCTCGSYGFRLDEDDWTRIVGGTPAAPNSIPFQVYFGSFLTVLNDHLI